MFLFSFNILVKSSLTTKTIIPPKITITGPEAPTEMELKKLDGLDSEQRLIHVKHLLNKKLLQKKTNNDTNVKPHKNLKPPTETTALQVQNNKQFHRKELITVANKVVTQQKGFIKLKDTEEVTPAKVIKQNKTKTPLKSLKDIARKINFQTETETNIVQQPQRNYKKSLNSEICTIPKASLQNSNSPDQIKQTNNKGRENYEKQKIDFPDMSPLKIHFPSANVPQETPLPAIDSFKKPYTLSNNAFYNVPNPMKDCTQSNLISSNYGTPTILPQSTMLGDNFNTQFSAASATGFGNNSASSSTNCLIVLENKVLSQDEMIDLTELRLSTSKVGTPRFATPHKPIPEVVIKQEKSDEYSTNSPPLPTEESINQSNIAKEEKIVNNKPSTNRVVISTKQNNKKIIINAHKLKLPPDQLATLAKQIAERTGVSKSNATMPIQHYKPHTINAFDDKFDNNQSLINTGNVQNYDHFNVNPKDNSNNRIINPLPSTNNIQLNTESYQNDHNYLPYPKQYSGKRIANKASIVCNQNTDAVEKTGLKETQGNESELDRREHNSNQFIAIVKEEPKLNDASSNVPNTFDQSSLTNTNTTNSIDDQAKSRRSSACYRKPAVEIVDEPAQMEDCFSAVDFIASLNETNPITEETSLELSPEELNLNASFAMNLSPLRIETQRNSNKQILAEPTVKDFSSFSINIGNIINVPENSLTPVNSQQLGTIVIESSNGPETILTSDNDNIIGDNTLKNVENANKSNNINVEIEKTKNLSQYNDKAQDHPQLLDKQAMNFVQNSINTNEPAKIMFDTLPVKNLNCTISEELQSRHKTTSAAREKNSMEISVEIVVSKRIDSQTALMKDINKTSLAENEDRLRELPKINETVSESLISLNNEQQQKDLQEPLAEVTVDYEKTKLTSVTSSSNAANKKSLETAKTLESGVPLNLNKCHQNNTTLKTNENTSTSSIPGKRISRFKKGKINLVQRNKTGAASTNKTIGPKLNDDKSIEESKINATTEVSGSEAPIVINREVHTESNNVTNKLSKNESKKEVNANVIQSKLPLNINQSQRNEENVESVENNSEHNINLKHQQENEISENKINQTIKEKDIPMSLSTEISKHLETNIVESRSTSIRELEKECKKQNTNSQSETNNEAEETISSLVKPNTAPAEKENNDIVKNLSQPKVSLIDIVKHSPPIVQGKPPIIPFKKNSPEICQKTQGENPKGIQNLLQQLKVKRNDLQKEKDESAENTNHYTTKCPMPIQESKDIANISNSEEPCITLEASSVTKTSNKFISNTTSTTDETITSVTTVNDKNENFTKQLTGDDDVEFLAVNTKIEKLNATKSCETVSTPSKEEKEENKCLAVTPLIKTKSAAYLGITPLSKPLTRRTRLYSKPLELSSPSSPIIKRTRFYSQSHNQHTETNDILNPSFATIQNNAVLDEKPKTLINEEYCQPSSSHDEKRTTPKKQRKKLRKTLDDLKKSQNSYCNTDSDDDDTADNFECIYDCGESNEFLGFAEDTSNSLKTTQNIPDKHNVEIISLAKTKGGTLKNWLTTGKAISPTLHEMESHNCTISSPVKRCDGPLKKRLDFSANLNEETDITDDTSPADDEEDESENILKNKRPKRGKHNVIDTDKNILASKKIKLDDKHSDITSEHKFIEPQQTHTNLMNSTTEMKLNVEKGTKRLDKKLLNNSSDKIETRRRKQPSPTSKVTNSETDSDCHEEKMSKRLKSKDKAVEYNKIINTDSDIEKQSGIKSDLNERKTSRRHKSKIEDVLKNSNAESDFKTNKCGKKSQIKITTNYTDSQKLDDTANEGNNRNNLECKKALDRSITPTNTDGENNNIKNKRSKRSMTNANAISQAHETESQKTKNLKTDLTTTKHIETNIVAEKRDTNKMIENKDTDRKKLKQKNKNVSEKRASTPASKKDKHSRVQTESSAQDVTSTPLANATTCAPSQKKNKNKKDDTSQQTPTPVSKKVKLSKKQSDSPKQDVEQPCSSKKIGVPLKRKLKDENSDSEDHSEKHDKPALTQNIKTNQKETPKPRGKKPSQVCNFNPRLLLITKREQYDTDEVLTVSEPSKGATQCGLCLERMRPSKWSLHLAQHYGIGWKVGEERLVSS